MTTLEGSPTPPVCTVCNDTHSMELRDRKVMCTHCPVPCDHCRQSGNGVTGPGAYCQTTPCACECHRPNRAATPRDVDVTADVHNQRLFGSEPSAGPSAPVTLARQVIDKYGADSPKPSVVLAKALLEGAHERDRLRNQIRELAEHEMSREAIGKILIEHAAALQKQASTTFTDTVKAATDLADQMMQQRDAALLKYEQAQERIADLEQQTCARHVGHAHGKEAEELRTGIEQILANTSDVAVIQRADAYSVLVGIRKSLQFLLDNTCARDSLAHLEATDATKGDLMTDYDMATLMKDVREYAEGYDVKLGEVQPGRHGGGGRRAYVTTEPRLVVWGLNEGGHNSVQIDLKDLLGWLVQNRPELVRDAIRGKLSPFFNEASRPCPPGFFCIHESKCPGCV